MLQTITSIINTEQSVVSLPSSLKRKRVAFDPSGAFILYDD
jgi:hypothetical protein